MTEGVSTNASSKKRQNHDDARISGLKKERDVMLVDNVEMETSLAKVGNVQPR